MTIEETFSFAEYLSYYYTTVRVDDKYLHKKGGQTYTTSEVYKSYLQKISES